MKSTNAFGVIQGDQTTLTFGAADTEKQFNLTGINGLLSEISLDIPDWTNAVTLTISLIRSDGAVRTAGPYEDNRKVSAILSWPVAGKDDVLKAVLSGVPGGAGGALKVTPYFI